jgi:pimeloyl-ACP methyl ester carboxylesterase
LEVFPIEFTSEGQRVQGRFFQAVENDEPVTLLFVPGWPADPEDFLGLGSSLSHQGINVMEFDPRGMQESEGVYTHTGALLDISAALNWLRTVGASYRFRINPIKLILGGFSNGGGLALAYAARDPSIKSLVSCAANDFGQFARQIQADATFSRNVHAFLSSTQAPKGSVRFDLEGSMKELIDRPDIFGLRENARHLADRRILMFGGWEDQSATIDDYQLPFYRSLKAAGAQDVTFITYHTNHNFSNVRMKLVADIAAWLLHGEKSNSILS